MAGGLPCADDADKSLPTLMLSFLYLPQPYSHIHTRIVAYSRIAYELWDSIEFCDNAKAMNITSVHTFIIIINEVNSE